VRVFFTASPAGGPWQTAGRGGRTLGRPMKIHVLAALWLAGVLSCSPAPPAPPPVAPPRAPSAVVAPPRFGERYRALREAAAEAYKRRDWPAFVAAGERASAEFSGHPVLLYNLACAYGVSGRAEDAARVVEQLADRRAYFDVDAEADFASVRESPAFARAAGRLGAVKRETRPGGEIAFSLSERDLLAEGVAHDAASGAFFVGSVHRRKIVRVEPGRAPRDFAAEGLLGVLGLDVDAERRLLWACTSALPEMQGYRESDRGRAEAVAFDLRTGALVRRVVVATGGRHACNDLAVAGGGEVLISDSTSGEVLRVGPAGEPLPLVPAGVLVSPQAIAVSPEAFFVADYALGIARVDRASGAVELLAPPAGAVLTGVDGLRFAGRQLVAVQNGVTPHRVVALTLGAGGRRVEGVRVLVEADPRWSEPTLGAVVGDAFYYVGNSQWQAFAPGASPPPDGPSPPAVFKLSL
jgi:hypothetical protein